MYVCYDIKGIQQFIFSVPRLKCIIGASSQIARFDDVTLPGIAKRDDCEHIFSGGGRGAIWCRSRETAHAVRAELVQSARELGLDIRIGVDEHFSTAALYADQLYPFVPAPEDLVGLPCAESGLWPVSGSDGKRVHPLIERRIEAGRPGNDYLRDVVFKSIRIPAPMTEGGRLVEFLRNVNPEEIGEVNGAKETDQQRARAGQCALGKRNRWAVIAMDVNDMGRQFDVLEETSGDEATYVKRLRIVSEEIKKVTHRAVANALVAAMEGWLREVEPELGECWYEERGQRYLVLPFRPLVLGGDDVILLCHCALAMDFVRTMAAEFTRLSVESCKAVEETHGFNPWPATDGRLTISAGVLFTKVTLPLHTAVPYAESLLANAKNEFRRKEKTGPPTPAAVDWETITDTMVDTPAARRNREVRFLDEEIDAVVQLTQRPYLLDVDPNEKDKEKKNRSFQSLASRVAELEVFPTSFRSDLKRALRDVWSERTRFRISMAKEKKYRELAKSLGETPVGTTTKKGNAWFVPLEEDEDGTPKPKEDHGKPIQSTDIVDAIELLDEKHRMTQETATR